MGVLTGSDGSVRVAGPWLDSSGAPQDRGPSGKPSVGRVVAWELRVGQRLLRTPSLGETFVPQGVGPREWTARVVLMWEAGDRSSEQARLLHRLVVEGSSSPVDPSLEVTLAVRSDPGNRAAYYGTATLGAGRIWLEGDAAVRAQLDLIGWGPLRYRSGFFDAGSFGVLEGQTFADLEGRSFAQMETLVDGT